MTSYYVLLICLVKKCVHEPDQTYCKTMPLIFPLLKTRLNYACENPQNTLNSTVKPLSSNHHQQDDTNSLPVFLSNAGTRVVFTPTSLYDVLGSLCCINTHDAVFLLSSGSSTRCFSPGWLTRCSWLRWVCLFNSNWERGGITPAPALCSSWRLRKPSC